MIRTSTIVYVFLFLALVGAYFYLRNRQEPADIELTVEPSVEVAQAHLFDAEEGTPSSIRIEAKAGDIVEVARDEDNAWALTQPLEAKADQAAAEAAASQITAMRILDTLPDIDPAIVGLDDPEYVLTVGFTSGVERSTDIGIVTPSETGYYVRAEAAEVMIVSRSAIDPLLGLLRNPPYLETPAPALPATDAHTPQSGVTATP